MSVEYSMNIFSGFKNEEEAMAITGIRGWGELVMKGYGFEGDGEYRDMQFRQEYSGEDSRVFVYSRESVAVGSIVLNPIGTFSDKRGYGLHGVVVLPEYRQHGIGRKLYEIALTLLEVDVLSGSSKTPAAVLARARGASVVGMRTFYGMYEVTSFEQNGFTDVHVGYVDEYLKEKGLLPSEVVHFKGVDMLLPEAPNLGGYPEYLKLAFNPVLEAQKMIGEVETAVQPLLSIKDDLLQEKD